MTPKYIILHHSAGPQKQTFEAINAYHKAKWDFRSALGFYAGYQYVITSDGVVTQARKDDEEGAHTIGYNQNSIGICVVGWYDDGHDKLPTEAQQRSLTDLLVKKMKEWGIPRENIKFHRDFATKTCPGMHITQEWVTKLLKTTTDTMDKKIREWAEKKAFKTTDEWIEYGYKKKDIENKLEDEIKKIKKTFEDKLSAANTDKENIKKVYEERIKGLEQDVVTLNNAKSEADALNTQNAEATKFFTAVKFAWQTLWKNRE